MAGSKTDTAIRYPKSDGQTRRIHDTTQDQNRAAHMQEQRDCKTVWERASKETARPPEQLLKTNMDQEGNPVPDPVQFSDGAKARKMGAQGDEQDMVEAANNSFI
ncbi:hypothetical protein V8E54_001390 [Elaphomyces granulatus]|jgi:hypothetical protein|uniref:Uncharacterized protein n=1 Tax=Elaphomyces granulatus TaxID=519963 RepID=A0A232LLW7_9EURO|nr:hypothetical protein Egran_07082 [Elaphomyces granulatus]